MKKNNNNKIHFDFDGHLEKPMSEMTPKEKLMYLSMQIKLRHEMKKRIKKIEK